MSESSSPIKLTVIVGSVRPQNYTSKAVNVLVQEVRENYPEISLEVIDPAELRLNLPGKEGDSAAETLQSIIEKSSGVILATPEYHGSYSSVIKLVIDNLGFPSKLEGKPIALLGVAAGVIGAIKSLEHLRSVASHVGAIVLPEVVSVAGVTKVFNDKGECLDEGTEKRIRSLVGNLIDYIG